MLYFNMEKEIEINGKQIVVKEFKYVQAVELQELTKTERLVRMFELSTSLTTEEVNKLSLKDGIALQKVINEVNGLDVNLDFQKPTVEKES